MSFRTGEEPPRGRLDVQLLWHRLRVDGDGDVVAILGPLLRDVPHPVRPVRWMRYEVLAADEGYRVLEEGDELAVVDSPAAASDLVYLRAHRRAFELASLAGWVRVHGATIDLDGGRVVVIGPSGSGKTTLAARLALDGIDVQGDESVLVRHGSSLAVPRPLHLKPGAEVVLPDLAPVIATAPRAGAVTVLDPVALGRVHPLREAPIDHLVLLGTGPSGGRGMEAGSRADALEALVREAFVVTESRARLVAALAPTAGAARVHRLAVGPPAAMVAALLAGVG